MPASAQGLKCAEPFQRFRHERVVSVGHAYKDLIADLVLVACTLSGRSIPDVSLQTMAAVMRRHLLDDISDPIAFSLANQADILFELDSDNSTVTSDVISELGLAVTNGTSSAIPVRLHNNMKSCCLFFSPYGYRAA